MLKLWAELKAEKLKAKSFINETFSTWLREFVDAKVDDRRLAHDLTSVGIAVENISGEGKNASSKWRSAPIALMP